MMIVRISPLKKSVSKPFIFGGQIVHRIKVILLISYGFLCYNIANIYSTSLQI